MLMFTGLTIIFATAFAGIISVDVQSHLSHRSKRNEKKIPEDCSMCGISTQELHNSGSPLETGGAPLEAGGSRLNDGKVPLIAGGSSLNDSITYPWMVSFRASPDYNTCGGAIIDKFYILTAAHCVTDASGEHSYDEHVHFQTESRKNMSRSYAIEKIIVHPKYVLKDTERTEITIATYDIALVKLKEEIKCDEYKNVICLPDDGFKLPLNAESDFAGWGKTDPSNKEPFPPLLQSNMKHLDYAECISALPEAKKIEDHMLCQGGNNQSVCYGDSGGPLMHKINRKYYVVGVASSETDKGCKATKPAIFTDVVKFLDWIRKEAKGSFLSFQRSKNKPKQRCKGRKKIQRRKNKKPSDFGNLP